MADPSDELKEMTVAMRIEAVKRDVNENEDRYRGLPPHELADLLGIDDADKPGPDWTYIKFVERLPLAESIDLNGLDSAILECLRGKVSPDRWMKIEVIGRQFDETCALDTNLLTKEEREIVEEDIANQELAWTDNVIGRISVASIDGSLLEFEGFIECDGECINLLTPYDKRDDKFTDLQYCVTDYY